MKCEFSLSVEAKITDILDKSCVLNYFYSMTLSVTHCRF